MSYRFVSNISREVYEQFIEKCRMVSFTQSYEWSEVKSNWGHFHCGLYRDDVLVAVALILVKKIFAGISFFYVPHGYVIDFENKEDLAAMTDGVRKLAKRNHAYMVKLDPFFCIRDNSFRDEKVEHLFSENYEIKHENMIRCGYKHQPLKLEMDKGFQPRVQIFIPLCDQDMNRLLPEQLKKNCRRAGGYFDDYQTKRGVSFEITDDPARLDDLMALLRETEKRHNIKLRNREYFEKILSAFKGYAYMVFGTIDLDQYYAFLKNDPNTTSEKLQKVIELKAEKESVVVLSAAIILLPENREGIRVSEYLYAGNALYLPGLHISKALVFECCKFSIQKDCDYFNLGGVEGTLDDPLTKFKRDFNGRIMEFIGEYDLPTSLLYYPVSIAYSAILTFYKRRNRKHIKT